MLNDGPFLDLQVPTLTVTQTVGSVGDGTQATLDIAVLYDGPFLDLQVPTLTVTQMVGSVGDGTQAALDIADVI